MTVTSQTIVLTLIAALMAVPAFFMFNKMPEAWLQDYDFDPKAENVRWAKRLKPYHIAIFAVIYAALVFISSAKYPEFLSSSHYLRVIGLFAALPGFTVIIMSDKLNRIIPDHVIIFNIALSVFYFISDFADGNLWISDGKAWYYFLPSSEAAHFFSSVFSPPPSRRQRPWAWEMSSFCSSAVFFPVSKD